MPKITYVGPDEYKGYDGSEQINLQAGESVEVSQETADRLKEDRPADFNIGNAKSPRRSGSAK